MIRPEFTVNPLLKTIHEYHRHEIVNKFNAISECSHEHYLCLRKYLDRVPYKYYSEKLFKGMLLWLDQEYKKNRNEIIRYIEKYKYEISKALYFLEEINKYDWHDKVMESDDFEVLRFIDQKIHPAYLRLVEGILKPLVHIVAYFARIARSKSTEGLDIWNIMNEVEASSLNELIVSYHDIVRNGIAHGGIIYLRNAIRYYDDKNNQVELSGYEIIRKLDDTVDECNALALAFKVFCLCRLGDIKTPQQIFMEELDDETKTPWWEIQGSVEYELQQGKQLIIYAYADTYDYYKVLSSVIQTGILAEYFSPGYARYFISIISKKAGHGWAGFDGVKLSEKRSAKKGTINPLEGIVENNLVFYSPKIKLPKILLRFETLKHSFYLHWKLAIDKFKVKLNIPNIIVRHTKIHKKLWGCVLNANVVIETPDNSIINKEIIRKYLKRIIKKALQTARQNKSVFNLHRYLPLGFARVLIFCKDYRKRRLESIGLEDDLIGSIQIKRIKRIKSPDLFGAAIEEKGNYRIAWNKSWENRWKNNNR